MADNAGFDVSSLRIGRHAKGLMVSAIALMSLPGHSLAQTADVPQSSLGDIIVTAQKRSEAVQDVAAAVTAYSADQLRERNINGIESLSSTVPGMQFTFQMNVARISIRGLGDDGTYGSSAEARVAYHLDGVYISRPSDILATFYGVDRVEVLRGPQGTLFGRNAVGGAVNVITRDPGDEIEANLLANIGTRGTVIFEAGGSVPLADGLSLRIDGKTQDHDDYNRNLAATGSEPDGINNLHSRAIRAKLKIEPTDRLRIVLGGDYYWQRDRSQDQQVGESAPNLFPIPFQIPLGGRVYGPKKRDVYLNIVPQLYREHWGLLATANYDISDSLEFVSITGYRKSHDTHLWDSDMSDANLVPHNDDFRAKQFSEEARLQYSSDRLDVIVGGYYFSENQTSQQLAPLDQRLFGIPGQRLVAGYNLGGTVKTTALAGFAEATFKVTDALSLTLGGRYSWEKKKKIGEFLQVDTVRDAQPFPYDNPLPLIPLFPSLNETNTWKNFTPKVSVKYDINPDAMVYATYSKGFKSGGYSIGYFTPGFKPEKLTNYEVGAKLDLLDKRLRLNAVGFIYEYKDIQVFRADVIATVIDNAGKAKVKGVELEVVALPFDGLRLDGSFTYTRARYSEFLTIDNTRPELGTISLAGNPLPNTPELGATYGIQYAIDTEMGTFIPRFEGTSRSKVYFDQFKNPLVGEKGYTTLNAFLNWNSPDDRYSASLYVTNLTNATHKVGGYNTVPFLGFEVLGNYQTPRIFGVKVGVNF